MQCGTVVDAETSPIRKRQLCHVVHDEVPVRENNRRDDAIYATSASRWWNTNLVLSVTDFKKPVVFTNTAICGDSKSHPLHTCPSFVRWPIRVRLGLGLSRRAVQPRPKNTSSSRSTRGGDKQAVKVTSMEGSSCTVARLLRRRARDP